MNTYLRSHLQDRCGRLLSPNKSNSVKKDIHLFTILERRFISFTCRVIFFGLLHDTVSESIARSDVIDIDRHWTFHSSKSLVALRTVGHGRRSSEEWGLCSGPCHEGQANGAKPDRPSDVRNRKQQEATPMRGCLLG